VQTTILRIQSSHHNFSNQNSDSWKLNKTFFLKRKEKHNMSKNFIFFIFIKKELKGHISIMVLKNNMEQLYAT